ncbi:MAG TPA: type II toxin-antitoxin system VapC family toxin [Streptosporangiaceae bacterium]|nr:type II toxin-antitoxin system VapC family toxin [Streptosporangiaceae bacterium]
MIYIDTSAVLKLVHPEPESGALRAWLAGHPDDLVSSALVRTEARRALLRNDPGALPGLPAILSVIAQIPVSETVLDSAAMFPDPLLRSLDAIHLASAQSITAVTAVLAYDMHLIGAVRNAGLAVASPA